MKASSRTKLKVDVTHVRTLPELGVAVDHYRNYINRRLRPHGPPAILFTCIVRGSGEHYMGNEVHRYRAGSVGITMEGQTHDILTDARGTEVYNVLLKTEKIRLPEFGSPLKEALTVLLPMSLHFASKAQRRVHLEVRDPEQLKALLKAMHEELRDRPPGYAVVVQSYLASFLALCCRSALENGFVSPGIDRDSPEARLEELRQYLDNHYAEPHTLEALAQRAGFSRTYLCRAFHKYSGRGVFEYIVERRIQGAMVDLRSASGKITAIAMSNGFNDLSHFNRTFRRLVGVSPSAYKKSLSA
jgi:AraC-like DNA-binding protein